VSPALQAITPAKVTVKTAALRREKILMANSSKSNSSVSWIQIG
jgi:hypothetical protein